MNGIKQLTFDFYVYLYLNDDFACEAQLEEQWNSNPSDVRSSRTIGIKNKKENIYTFE